MDTDTTQGKIRLHMKPHPSGGVRQTGSIIVVTVLGLVVLVGMLGFVADIGHLFVNKSRLQTVLDSTVLSAAYTLDSVDSQRCVHLFTAAQVTYNSLLNLAGNEELKSLLPADIHSLTWQVSDTLSKDPADWKDPATITADCPGKRFVRVEAPLNGLRSFFMQVPWGGDPGKSVAAAAVAGITECGTQSAPVFMCAKEENIPTDIYDPCGSDGDSDPTTCFGLQTGREVCSKAAAAGSGGNYQNICQGQPNDYSPGNFGWLDAGSGATSLKDTMAGTSVKECTAENALNITETGNVTSVATDFNKAKFGQISNNSWTDPTVSPNNSSTDPTYCYRGDLWCPNASGSPDCAASPNQVSSSLNPNSCIKYNYYHTSPNYTLWGKNTGNPKFLEQPLVATSLHTPWSAVNTADPSPRMAVFSVANCNSLSSGKGVVDIIGHICVFYTRPLAHEGNVDNLIVELVKDTNCPAVGNSYSPIRIVLYKDPLGGDS